jgi:HEAT repeat protein
MMANVFHTMILEARSAEQLIEAVIPFMNHSRPIVRSAVVAALAAALPDARAVQALSHIATTAEPGVAKEAASQALDWHKAVVGGTGAEYCAKTSNDTESL